MRSRLCCRIPFGESCAALLVRPGDGYFGARLRRGRFTLAQGGPLLNFGGAIPRKKGAVLHGGRVKLGHLERAFPEGRDSYNILYLVSSAIPRHALDLVKFAQSHGVKFVWNQNGVGFPAWAGRRDRRNQSGRCASSEIARTLS